jgi:hypothetical protein
MAISIVNGFFCANSCDVSKAKKGENPHPSTDPAAADGTSGGGPEEAPAVRFGGSLGSLSRLAGPDRVEPPASAEAAQSSPSWNARLIDRLV